MGILSILRIDMLTLIETEEELSNHPYWYFKRMELKPPNSYSLSIDMIKI